MSVRESWKETVSEVSSEKEVRCAPKCRCDRWLIKEASRFSGENVRQQNVKELIVIRLYVVYKNQRADDVHNCEFGTKLKSL